MTIVRRNCSIKMGLYVILLTMSSDNCVDCRAKPVFDFNQFSYIIYVPVHAWLVQRGNSSNSDYYNWTTAHFVRFILWFGLFPTF